MISVFMSWWMMSQSWWAILFNSILLHWLRKKNSPLASTQAHPSICWAATGLNNMSVHPLFHWTASSDSKCERQTAKSLQIEQCCFWKPQQQICYVNTAKTFFILSSNLWLFSRGFGEGGEVEGGHLRLRKCYAFLTVQRGRLCGHPLPARLIYLLPPCGDQRGFFFFLFFFLNSTAVFPSHFTLTRNFPWTVGLMWTIDEPFLSTCDIKPDVFDRRKWPRGFLGNQGGVLTKATSRGCSEITAQSARCERVLAAAACVHARMSVCAMKKKASGRWRRSDHRMCAQWPERIHACFLCAHDMWRSRLRLQHSEWLMGVSSLSETRGEAWHTLAFMWTCVPLCHVCAVWNKAQPTRSKDHPGVKLPVFSTSPVSRFQLQPLDGPPLPLPLCPPLPLMFADDALHFVCCVILSKRLFHFRDNLSYFTFSFLVPVPHFWAGQWSIKIKWLYNLTSLKCVS